MFATLPANFLARKRGKIFGVKTLAELVKEHRSSLGLTVSEYARRIGTSRQNIDNIEAGEAKQPRYIAQLAKFMGRSVDELLGRAAPSSGAAPAGWRDAAACRDEDEANLLAAYRALGPEDAQRAREQLLLMALRAKSSAGDEPVKPYPAAEKERARLVAALDAIPAGPERQKRFAAALGRLEMGLDAGMAGGALATPGEEPPSDLPKPSRVPAPGKRTGKSHVRT